MATTTDRDRIDDLRPTATGSAEAGHDTDGTRPDLRCVIVEYQDRSDRCTVYPPTADRIARMSSWLSTDRSLLGDLDGIR